MIFVKIPFIITVVIWPVSQTVKTLRSQRREYGFESHTGHQRSHLLILSGMRFFYRDFQMHKQKCYNSKEKRGDESVEYEKAKMDYSDSCCTFCMCNNGRIFTGNERKR